MFGWTVPNYEQFTVGTWIAYIVFATAGWLCQLAVRKAAIEPPTIRKHSLFLNSAGDWLASVVIGLLANHSIIIVTVAAIATPGIVKAIMVGVPASLRRMLGGDTDGPHQRL